MMEEILQHDSRLTHQIPLGIKTRISEETGVDTKLKIV